MAEPLSCETLKEIFSEVTPGFNSEFTAPPEPVLLDLTGSNYRLGRCLLPPLMHTHTYQLTLYLVVCWRDWEWLVASSLVNNGHSHKLQ